MNKEKSKELTQRLLERGAEGLTSIELLAMVLQDESAAYAIAGKLDNQFKKLSTVTIHELSRLPGMTTNKASRLTAALEFGRRKNLEQLRPRIMVASSDSAAYLQELLEDEKTECFYVLFLNRANAIIGEKKIAMGGITMTVCDPRIIFKEAIDRLAVNLILCHNHPSGNLKPSKQDEELTYKIKEGARFFDMQVLDHVIVSSQGWFSFADEGLL